MSVSASYLHAISGRIRIKIAGVRGAAEEARRLEDQLAVHTGVQLVRANPITGNVLIHYDPDATREREIIRALRRLGWLRRVQGNRAVVDTAQPGELASLCAEKALTVGLEMFLLRLLKIA